MILTKGVVFVQSLVMTPRSRCPIVSNNNSSLATMALRNNCARNSQPNSDVTATRNSDVTATPTSSLENALRTEMASVSQRERFVERLRHDDAVRPLVPNETVSYNPRVGDTPQKLAEGSNTLARTNLLTNKSESERKSRSLVRRKSTLKNNKNKSDSQITDVGSKKDEGKKSSSIGKSMRRSLSRRLSKSRRRRSGKGEGDKSTEDITDASPHAGSKYSCVGATNSPVSPYNVSNSYKSPSLSPFTATPTAGGGGAYSGHQYSSSTSEALGHFFRHLSSSSLAQIAHRLKTNNDPSLRADYKLLTPIQSDTSADSVNLSLPQTPVGEMDESLSLVFREYLETRSMVTANSSEMDSCSWQSAGPSPGRGEEYEGKCRSVPVLDSDDLYTTVGEVDTSSSHYPPNTEVRSQSCDAIHHLQSFANHSSTSVPLSFPPDSDSFIPDSDSSCANSADSVYHSHDRVSETNYSVQSLPVVSSAKLSAVEDHLSLCNLDDTLSNFNTTSETLDENVIRLKVSSSTPSNTRGDTQDESRESLHPTDEMSDSLLRCLDGQNLMSVSCDDNKLETTNVSSAADKNTPTSGVTRRTNLCKVPAQTRMSYKSAVELGTLISTDVRKLTSLPEAGDKENVDPTPRASSSKTKKGNTRAGNFSGALGSSSFAAQINIKNDDKISKCGLCNDICNYSHNCSSCGKLINCEEISVRCSDCNKTVNCVKSSEFSSCSPSGRGSVLGNKQGTPKRISTPSSTALHFETNL